MKIQISGDEISAIDVKEPSKSDIKALAKMYVNARTLIDGKSETKASNVRKWVKNDDQAKAYLCKRGLTVSDAIAAKLMDIINKDFDITIVHRSLAGDRRIR